MNTTLTPKARHLLANDYVPADRTRDILAPMLADDIIMKRLSRMIGVDAALLTRIARGQATYVARETANAIDQLDRDEVYTHCRREPNRLDDVVYERIKAGKYARIPYGHKRIYARALHAEGWSLKKIATTLHMSGATVREAITNTHNDNGETA
ncbi:hypothetical protein [Nocardia ignorata]|uniref:Uncharacterized protein n=1 Tax=Nocardia ignorata TaxID=145285 RepID=A0A4R6NYN7_NOCIG|nr:hypothetical protein [Nocardia ignorata]TDP29896.1 hypothetical protein DFR75_112165 [Nocardia ignorata]